MKFTTPCFVRIEDADKRKELPQFLPDIGRKALGSADQPYMVASIDSVLWCNLDVRTIDTMIGQGYIDCGTDIELFKALAAMNDKNDREQWFTDTADGFSKCSVDRWLDEWQPEYHDRYSIWRKATAEEIVEYFKNR